MSGKPTVRLVRWKPTRYGVLVSFMAANRATCKTAQERRHAEAVISAVSDSYHLVKHQFEPLTKIQFTDASFRDACARFENFPDLRPSDVLLAPEAWTWLKKQFEEFPEVGTFASLRVAADRSIDEAKEEDVEVSA